MLGEDKRKSVLQQHAITMADAYPRSNNHLGIDAQAIVDYCPKKDWVTFDPG
jgi:hypothetical protein